MFGTLGKIWRGSIFRKLSAFLTVVAILMATVSETTLRSNLDLFVLAGSGALVALYSYPFWLALQAERATRAQWMITFAWLTQLPLFIFRGSSFLARTLKMPTPIDADLANFSLFLASAGVIAGIVAPAVDADGVPIDYWIGFAVLTGMVILTSAALTQYLAG